MIGKLLCLLGQHRWIGDIPGSRTEALERMVRGQTFLKNWHCRRCGKPAGL
jgi:hypothetical protein